MARKQGGFSLIAVLLVIVLILAGVIFYFISSFVVTDRSVGDIVQSVSVGNHIYKSSSWGFGLSYPKKISSEITADLKEKEDGVEILGHENFYPYAKVTVEWSNADLLTWWEGKPTNEIKKYYKNARQLLLKKEPGFEVGFTSGTEWQNHKEYLLRYNGRNYWVILYHGNCEGCSERNIESNIWESFNFLDMKK